MIHDVLGRTQNVFRDIEPSERMPANAPRLTRTMAIVTFASGLNAILDAEHNDRSPTAIFLDGLGVIGTIDADAATGSVIQMLITPTMLVVLRCNHHPMWDCDPPVAALLLYGNSPFFEPTKDARAIFTSKYPVEAMRAVAELGADAIVSASQRQSL